MALLEPAQWFCELRLLGLVCEKDRTQGVVDVEVASKFQYEWALDPSRRRHAGKLAGLDEKL
jgi:hypothetical protein